MFLPEWGEKQWEDILFGHKEETYKYEQDIEDSLEVYPVASQKTENKTEIEVYDLLNCKFKLYRRSKIY